MAGIFAGLVIPYGVQSLHCPITGRAVITEDGFNTDAEHTPHLRFAVDWVGDVWIADGTDMPEDAALYLKTIRDVFEGGDVDESINDLIAKACNVLPPSALVLELMEPARGGGHGGESGIFYACFDLAGSHGEVTSVRLMGC